MKYNKTSLFAGLIFCLFHTFCFSQEGRMSKVLKKTSLSIQGGLGINSLYTSNIEGVFADTDEKSKAENDFFFLRGSLNFNNQPIFAYTHYPDDVVDNDVINYSKLPSTTLPRKALSISTLFLYDLASGKSKWLNLGKYLLSSYRYEYLDLAGSGLGNTYDVPITYFDNGVERRRKEGKEFKWFGRHTNTSHSIAIDPVMVVKIFSKSQKEIRPSAIVLGYGHLKMNAIGLMDNYPFETYKDTNSISYRRVYTNNVVGSAQMITFGCNIGNHLFTQKEQQDLEGASFNIAIIGGFILPATSKLDIYDLDNTNILSSQISVPGQFRLTGQSLKMLMRIDAPFIHLGLDLTNFLYNNQFINSQTGEKTFMGKSRATSVSLTLGSNIPFKRNKSKK
jgi:hypothetical protein